jgi:monofunctional biosynthetic peptidoglycan transglycosylase
MHGGHLRGASTISQQVARNLFLWQGRSWLRKGLESWMTVLIETLWTKQRILEVYLNIAETGPQTFGVQAAHAAFWGTSRSPAVATAVGVDCRRFAQSEPDAHSRPSPCAGTSQPHPAANNALGGTAYLRDILPKTVR